jgi:hypothetical protein
MIHMPVSDAQRCELEPVSRQAVGRVALRAHMALLSARGHSMPQIAAIYDCGCGVVRPWRHRCEHEGVAGLEDEPCSGRPPPHPLAGHIVETQVNPVVRLEGLMKEDVADNRLAGSIEELSGQARRFFAGLSAHPIALPQAA